MKNEVVEVARMFAYRGYKIVVYPIQQMFKYQFRRKQVNYYGYSKTSDSVLNKALDMIDQLEDKHE